MSIDFRLLQAGRILAGLTQEQLAAIASVSTETVVEIETGQDASSASVKNVRQALRNQNVYLASGEDFATVSIVIEDDVEGHLGQSDGAGSEPRTERDIEHYGVATSFAGKEFTRSDFLKHYEQMFPNRNHDSILPADYSLPSSPSTRRLPKFLRRTKRGVYKLIESNRFGVIAGRPPIAPLHDNSNEGDNT